MVSQAHYFSAHSWFPTKLCRYISLHSHKRTSIYSFAHLFLLTSNHQFTIHLIKQQLHNQFIIKDLGPLHYYLGIEILGNSHGLTMSQRKYTLELLKCGNVLNDRQATTPIDPISSLNQTDGESLQDPFL